MEALRDVEIHNNRQNPDWACSSNPGTCSADCEARQRTVHFGNLYEDMSWKSKMENEAEGHIYLDR